MKKIFRISIVFLVLLLLCLIGGKNEITTPNSIPSKEKSDDNFLRLKANNATICFDSRVTTIILGSNSSISKVVKTYFFGFYPNENQIEHTLKQTISRNSIFSKNGFIQFSPTDIIFPFHYFW